MSTISPRRLLLTSEGLFTPRLTQSFLDLVGKATHEISIAFIPTGSNGEDNHEGYQRNLEPLEALGFKKIEVVYLENHTAESLSLLLENFDVIWVNGGNTFYLLHWVRQTGFEAIMNNLLAAGKVYVGVSAGTILACPTIEIALWKGYDDPTVVNLPDLKSFDWVPFYIFVHYGSEWEKLVEDERRKLPRRLVVLKNEQAIQVTGNDINIIE